MRRPTAAVTFLLAALLLAGCGKKPPRQTTDITPDPIDPPPMKVEPPAPADPSPAVPPAQPGPTPIPPFVAYGPAPGQLPVAPPPSEPGMGMKPPDPVPFQPPTPPPMLPPPPPPDMKEKEKDKSSVKPEWPREINGRTLTEYVKDAGGGKDLGDGDPAVRERAMRIIPNFGPENVKKELGWPKAALARMDQAKERDPGVRAAAIEAVGLVGFEKEADTKEAVRILFLTAEKSGAGSAARLHAIQALAAFGSKAETAITYLVGPTMQDVAYETRRSVAFTLGRISLNEHTGPNPRALSALLTLTEDHSAPVRMEAYQSLTLLGPPLLPRDAKAPLLKDIKSAADVPKTDEKQVVGYVAIIKKRLAPYVPPKGGPPSPTGVVERDKQVEIMARLVLLRFDQKEPPDEHLSAIAKYVHDKETGPRLQALNVLGLLGPVGAKKIDDVARALLDEDATIVVAALTTLVQFGQAGKPAIPSVERLRERGTSKEEREYWVRLVDQVVKIMKDSDKMPEKKP